MELAEFITSSLTQLTTGIVDARESVESAGGAINPSTRDRPAGRSFPGPTGMLPIMDIEFDVAVSASEKEGAKVGLGIVVAAMTLGGSTDKETGDEQVSRLRFTIPMVFPPGASRIEIPGSDKTPVEGWIL